MTDYRNNQVLAPNPWVLQQGLGPTDFYGLSVMGAFNAAQAEFSSFRTILTQVIPWPWAADDAGVAFDQANLVGVRTRCWDDAHGGDIDWWTAVPRTLPVGYTAVGRCGRIVPMIADHLGDDPMLSPVTGGWRTETGVETTFLTPSNLNQRTFLITSDPIDPWSEAAPPVSVTYPVSPCHPAGGTETNPFRTWAICGQVVLHAGFRGGKLVLRMYSTSAFPCGIHAAGDTRIVIGWNQPSSPVAAASLPDNIVFDESYSYGDLSDIGPDGPYLTRLELEVSLPSMIPAADYPVLWYVMQGYQHAGDEGTGIYTANLSPRTDFPLWYFASTGNLIAPGGIP